MRVAMVYTSIGFLAATVWGQTVQQASLFGPMLEWSAVNPSYSGNPFDLSATVTFRHVQSGETRTTGMFYDGDNTWRFRFTGDLPGMWEYSSSSADNELNALTGAVDVAAQPASGASGLGFVTGQGNRWAWQRAGQSPKAFVPQLVMYQSNPARFDPAANPGKIASDIQTFMVCDGFNGFHVPIIAGRWFDYAATSPLVSSSMADPDPRTFRALEALITQTHEAGGMVHLWAWGDQEDGQTPINLTGGINGATDQRLQRYIAARLGPVPGWTMGYGFDLNEWAPLAEVEEWAQRIDSYCGWSHPLGGRPAGPNTGADHSPYVEWNDDLGYASYEHHNPDYGVYSAALTAGVGGEPLPLPVLSEDRFRIRDWYEKDYDMVEVRRGLWRSTIAGGVGNIWGNLLDGGSNEDGSAAFPQPQWVRTYADFFAEEGRFTLEMEAADQLVVGDGVHALRDSVTGRLIVYIEDSGSVELVLPAGSHYRIIAVDALRAYVPIDLGSTDPGASGQTLQLPAASDWALDLVPLSAPEPGAMTMIVLGSAAWALGRRRGT